MREVKSDEDNLAAYPMCSFHKGQPADCSEYVLSNLLRSSCL